MKKNKLLILGASGFIGKNLAIFFSKKKNFNVTGTYFRKKTHINNVKMLKCDLTKKKEADKLIKNSNIISFKVSNVINSKLSKSQNYKSPKNKISCCCFKCSCVFLQTFKQKTTDSQIRQLL